MTVRNFDFENGPHGATVTNAHLGSGTIVLGSDGPPTYSNAWSRTGSLSAHFTAASSGNYILTQLSGDRVSIRLYARFNTITSNTMFLTIRNANADIVTINVLSDGQLNIGSLVSSGASNLIPTDGTPVRIGVSCIRGTTASNGTVRAYLAIGDNTPIWEYETTTANTGTQDIVDVRFGKPGGSGAMDVHIDSVVASNETADLIGPVQNPNPVANAGAHQAVLPGEIVHLNGSGSTNTNSYSWSFLWPSSGAPALTGANTATPSFTAGSVGSVYTLQLAASNGSQIDTATVNVAAVSSVPEESGDLVWTGSAWE